MDEIQTILAKSAGLLKQSAALDEKISQAVANATKRSASFGLIDDLIDRIPTPVSIPSIPSIPSTPEIPLPLPTPEQFSMLMMLWQKFVTYVVPWLDKILPLLMKIPYFNTRLGGLQSLVEKYRK